MMSKVIEAFSIKFQLAFMLTISSHIPHQFLNLSSIYFEKITLQNIKYIFQKFQLEVVSACITILSSDTPVIYFGLTIFFMLN